MANVVLFSDSTCDLPQEIICQENIEIVPLYVIFNDKPLRDGIDITTPALYERVREGNNLPTTAAPSPGDFIAAFSPHIEAGNDILYVGLSAELSATNNNARLAAEHFPPGRVEVVDSRNLSSATGLLILKAADRLREGRSKEEIAHELRVLAPQVHTEFIIDILDYLHKGGRCSGLARLMGSMLSIRPVVKVVDGRMVPAEKLRGSRKKALNTLLSNALAKKEKIKGRVFVTHSVSEDGPYLREQLLAQTQASEVIISQAGCVISSHCGPNTIGILFIQE